MCKTTIEHHVVKSHCCKKMHVGLRMSNNELWRTKVDGRGTFKCLYLFTRILLYGLQRTTHHCSEWSLQIMYLLPQTVPVAQRRQLGRVKTAITDTDDDLFMRLLKNSWPSKLPYYSRTMSGNVGLATLQSSL